MQDKTEQELTEEEKEKLDKAEKSPNPVREMSKGSIVNLDDYVI